MRPLHLVAATALCAVAVTAQTATTITLEPSKDSTLYEDLVGDLANGGGEYVFAGLTLGIVKRRALVQFDIAGNVPSGARIVTASLQMNVSQSQWFDPLEVTLHRVLEDWNEGTTVAPGMQGGGGLAQPGDVTWLHRDRPTVLWTFPGGDFNPVPSAATLTPQFGLATWNASQGMLADLNFWRDNPIQNAGWLFKTDEVDPLAVRRFDSRENANPAARPQLTITYAMPGEWAAVGSGCGAPTPTLAASGTISAGGDVTFTLTGTPGVLGANFLSLGLIQPPFALSADCALFLNPFAVTNPGLAVTDINGEISTTVAIPSTPSFTGLPLSSQGGLLDATAPAGFALSNAVLAVIN